MYGTAVRQSPPAMMYLKQTAFLLVSPFSFQDLALWRDRLPLDFTRLHMHRLMIFTAIDLFYAQGQLSLLLTQISLTRKAISMVSPRHVTFSFNCYRTHFPCCHSLRNESKDNLWGVLPCRHFKAVILHYSD